MAARRDAIRAPDDPRTELSTDMPEYGTNGQRLLDLARGSPPRAWHAAARVDGEFAGRAWSLVTGDLAGVYDMEVWPRFQRRGLGRSLRYPIEAVIEQPEEAVPGCAPPSFDPTAVIRHPVGVMGGTRLRCTLTSMIERLTDMPPGTIGFRVAGEIERDDYDKVLVPDLQRGLDAGDGLRTLYVIDSLDEMEPAAIWADAKVGFNLGMRHREAWVRSAIVTDIEWLARSTKLFAWMIPGEARVFPAAELEQAKAWVAGS